MATLIRLMIIIVVWGAFFSSATFLFSSRANEDLLSLQKAINDIETWESFVANHHLALDGEEEISIESDLHQDPYLAHIVSRARLTDDEDFKFEVYFNPEAIYIHSFNSDLWNKTEYTHPVAGELEGMKDPAAFWIRMLKYTEKIVKEETPGGGNHFKLFLSPFRDEVYGIQFNDIVSAHMEAWVSAEPARLQKTKVVMNLKPNVIRRYNQITYITIYSGINHAQDIILPAKAKGAPSMN